MRRLGRGLLALVLVLAAVSTLMFGWRQWDAWRSLAPERSAELDERVLFEPVRGQPLGFNVSTHQGWFALHGLVAAPAEVRRRGLGLTVEIRLQGARDAAPEKRYLTLPPADAARPYGVLDGRQPVATWTLPTEWIDLTARPDVRSVSVRVLDAPPGVRAVLWRGEIDQRLSDSQVRLRYRQLSDASRDALTLHWVMPPALVDPRAKQELLRYRRQRIGPLGQPGEAYEARRVLRRQPSAAPRRHDTRPLAVPIGPALDVGIALDDTREVVIDARRADGSPLPFTASGPFGQARQPATRAAAGRWGGSWGPGRYLLQSEAAGDVEVRDAGSGDSLVPSGPRPRTHRISPTRRLRYRLHPLGEAPPPLRLRLRAEQADARVRVHFLDAAGTRVASRSIEVPWRASRYDRLSATLDRPASEPVQLDIAPPASARGLVLAADRPVLAVVLTTLPVSGQDGDARAGRWFSFQPLLDPRSVLFQGIVVIEQPRPIARARVRAAPGARATPGEVQVAPRQARPRLRLRPARADPTEPADAE